ncbi:MAG TPA: transcriptional regulator [Coriobacteriia bacterium]|nr:transcriptional regulator [Coriobacteriia bacterium]
MRMFRIGDKVVSRDKLVDALEAILEDRESGATQEEAARHAGVQRSFVSFLETLGEVRRGPKVALVAFPVNNVGEIRALAEEYALDFVLVLSQDERESIESGDATEVFNRLLETLAALREFDTVVLAASNWRVETLEKILGAEIVGIPLGPSPLRHAVELDAVELRSILDAVMNTQRGPRGRTGRVGQALKDAADLAGRWTQSRKSSA